MRRPQEAKGNERNAASTGGKGKGKGESAIDERRPMRLPQGTRETATAEAPSTISMAMRLPQKAKEKATAKAPSTISAPMRLPQEQRRRQKQRHQ